MVCLLAISPAAAQTASASSPTSAPTTAAPATTADGPPIALSPFEVTASTRDTRYHAENTLAGSRLNSQLGDLGASITIVTKQQLNDTAARDINDVFLYEANTESTGNYTAFAFDGRGGVADHIAGNQPGVGGIATLPNMANRVRGLARATNFRDYYQTIERNAFDTYNTERVEINRGPNAILFGLGSSAGIVNQTPARALMHRATGEIAVRADSEGGRRASLAVNRPLVPDRLALHYAALHDERGFSRQPSYDISRRHYGALAFKPYAPTTLRANFEHYDNRDRRPNSLTPRDLVTPWLQAGRPAWDPLNRTLTVNGVTTGPFDTPASLETVTSAVKADANHRPVFLNDRGTDAIWILRQIDLPGGANNEARYTRSSGAFDQSLRAPLFVQPGISDRALYDWERINLVSGNFGFTRTKTANVEIEQQLRPNLHLQLGWFTEEIATTNHYYLSQQTGVTVYVDPNTRWLDGTPNPYFGAPYVEVFAPDMFENTGRNENWRATLAWELDFARKAGWPARLGRHRLMGLATYRDVVGKNDRWREVVVSPEAFTAPSGANAWASAYPLQNEIDRRFYVGAPGGTVTRDPGKFPNAPLETNLRTYDPATGRWLDEPVSLENRLHFLSGVLRQRTDSAALALQSYLWHDRAILTAGWRRDLDEVVNASTLPIDPATGFTDPAGSYLSRRVQRTAGNSTTLGLVLKPLPWLNVHANRSGNFTPTGYAQDIFARPLPVPTARGTDFGFRVAFLENRLHASVNAYTSSAENFRGAAPLNSTVGMDSVVFSSWASGLVRSRLGPAIAAPELEAEVAKIMQLPPGWLAAMSSAPTTTSAIEARGLEFQLIFNPVENWTLKITGGRQRAIVSRIAPDWDEWVALRRTVWNNAVDDRGVSFWAGATGLVGANGGPGVAGNIGSQTPAQSWELTVTPQIRLARAREGTFTPTQREWRGNLLTNYEFTHGKLRGLGVGGAIRWEDKAAIGFYGSAPEPDGVIRDLDSNRPIYDDTTAHLDLWLAYALRLPRAGGENRRLKFQLNLRDAGERMKLRAVAANPDGTPSVFRIADGQLATFTATLSF